MTDIDRKQRRRAPAPVTAETIKRAAENYVARFASSAAQLKTVLMRRVERSARHHGTDPEKGEALADEIVTRYIRLGILDDTAFARSRALSLFRRGDTPQAIRYRLLQQGVAESDIDAALDNLLEETPEADSQSDLEFTAAITFARRSRIGPFRRKPADDDLKRRELARMARRGFGFDIAKKVVYAETEEELVPQNNQESFDR